MIVEDISLYTGQLGYGGMVTNRDRINVLSSINKDKQCSKLYKVKFSISIIRIIFMCSIKKAIDYLRMIYHIRRSYKE